MSTATFETPVSAPKKRKGTALRVKGHGPGFLFGSEPHGKVLPIHWAERCGRSAEQLVADGDMEWTDDLPVGDFKIEVRKDDLKSDITAALSEENERYRRSNVEISAHNRQLEGENAELKRSKDNQTVQLGEQSEQIAHWRKLAEDRERELEILRASHAERDQTVESLNLKNQELTDRLETLLKVPALKSKKTEPDAPLG
jgi:septal ring factor EnvC (AmiA/AmiB activator)